jgi:hypothetical protein
MRLKLMLTAFIFLLSAPHAYCALDFDPKSPLRWHELMDCELVIVGHYHSHKEKTLSLKVLRVLKGKDVKSGDIIAVALTHRYSNETGAVGWEAMLGKKVESYPKLCYLTQLMNPGGLHPVLLGPDVREPNLYFLPKASKPALERRNQVHDLRWEEGWRQAVQGQPMDLCFRLLQTQNPSFARDALEELFESRDSATLHRLADKDDAPEETILVAVGRQKQDVYKLIHERWLKDVGVTTPPEPTDVERLVLQLGSLPLSERQAAHRALEKIGEPILATLERAVAENHDFEISRRLEILAQTISNRAFDKKRLNGLSISARRLAKIDPDRAWPLFESALTTAPKVVKKEVTRALQYLDDERALRLAFKLLKEPYLAEEAVASIYGFVEGSYLRQENRWHHRPVPPSVSRFRQIAKPELKAALARSSLTANQREWLGRCLARLEALEEKPKVLVPRFFMHTPVNVDDLCRWVHACGRRGLKNARFPQAVIADLCNAVEKGPWVGEYLQILFDLDAAKAKPLLERALHRRKEYDEYIRGHLLAVAVRHGHADLVDELIATVRTNVAEEHKREQEASRHTVLLLADHSKAYAEYLRICDEAKRLVYWRWNQEQRLAPEYYASVLQLFPNHAGDFFKRVLALLESKSLREREAGEELLRQTLKRTFGYDSFAFSSQRAAQLARLRPKLKSLAAMPEVQMRAFVLRDLGVTLPGPPSSEWIPVLRQAASGKDATIVENVLLVLEEIAAASGCHELHDWPPNERAQVLAAFFERDNRREE